MDDLIEVFVDTYYNEQQADDINKSLDLFDFYEYNQAFPGLIDIAVEHSTTSNENLIDRFTLAIHERLNYLLSQHTLILIDEATIDEKNQILAALGHLQKLQDYGPVIGVLESLEDDTQKLAMILSDHTLLDETQLMTLIVSFSEDLLGKLKEYIYTIENSTQSSDEPVRLDLITNLRVFNEFTNDRSLASAALQAGTSLSQRFVTYLNYFKDDIVVDSNEATAYNFLSVLFMSGDGYNSPLLVYRKYSLEVIQDLNRVSKVENILLDLIAKFTEFKKVHHDATRLSEVRSTT